MEHTGLTQRPPAYAELLVDSLDRYRIFPIGTTQTTSSDWQTKLNQIVLNGYFTRLAVTQIHFQWNLPTIITGYNDTIRMAYQNAPAPPVPFNLTIPEGYYTPDALADAIQVALIAVSAAPGFTCVYSSLTGAFTIACATAGYTVGILVPGPDIAINQQRFMLTTGLYPAFGIPPAPTITGAMPTMLPTRFIDICSSTLTKYQRVKDTTSLVNPTISNIIARIYPTAPNTVFQTTGNWVTAPTELPGNALGSHPFTICIDYNTPKHMKWDPNEPLSNFDLQLRDDFGKLLPWSPASAGPSCEYQLTIVATES